MTASMTLIMKHLFIHTVIFRHTEVMIINCLQFSLVNEMRFCKTEFPLELLCDVEGYFYVMALCSFHSVRRPG